MRVNVKERGRESVMMWSPMEARGLQARGFMAQA